MVIEEIEDEEVIVVTEPVVVQAEKSELENEPQVKDEGSIVCKKKYNFRLTQVI